MDILYLLIPLSVVLVFAIGAIFWYALRSGQFDDLEGPAIRILLDDDRPPASGDDLSGDHPSGVNLSGDKAIDGFSGDIEDNASSSREKGG